MSKNRNVITTVGLIVVIALLGASLPLLAEPFDPQAPPPGTGQVAFRSENPDGSLNWVLLVGPNFTEADLQQVDPAAHLDWHWPEAGIAAARSTSEILDGEFTSSAITGAVPDVLLYRPEMAAEPMEYDESMNGDQPDPAGGSSPGVERRRGWGYYYNFAWYHQAIGASRPNPQHPHGWDPIWQLFEDDQGNMIDWNTYDSTWVPGYHAYEGTGIRIGIVDTGAPAHWRNGNAYDPVENNAFPYPEARVEVYNFGGTPTGLDQTGHGTYVASLIASRGARYTAYDGFEYPSGTRGLAPDADLVFYDIAQNVGNTSLINILAAWEHASRNGVQILNNSWGRFETIPWPLRPQGISSRRYYAAAVFGRAAKELRRAGCLLVFSAGNDSLNHTFDFRTAHTWEQTYMMAPNSAAAFFNVDAVPNALVVGGTAPRDYGIGRSTPYWMTYAEVNQYTPAPSGVQKGAQYNLDRPCTFSATGTQIDIVAPAGEPTADFNNGMFVEYVLPGWYNRVRGTSFACPLVAGAAALAAEAYERNFGHFPQPARLKQILRQSADDLVGPATDTLLVWNNTTRAYGDLPKQRHHLGSGSTGATNFGWHTLSIPPPSTGMGVSWIEPGSIEIRRNGNSGQGGSGELMGIDLWGNGDLYNVYWDATDKSVIFVRYMGNIDYSTGEVFVAEYHWYYGDQADYFKDGDEAYIDYGVSMYVQSAADTPGEDMRYGKGRLNVKRAIEVAKEDDAD